MHEYPITLQIIKIAEKYAKDTGASKFLKVKDVVRGYSDFIGKSIQMYFDIISEGILCEIQVKPKLKCVGCGETVRLGRVFIYVPGQRWRGRPDKNRERILY